MEYILEVRFPQAGALVATETMKECTPVYMTIASTLSPGLKVDITTLACLKVVAYNGRTSGYPSHRLAASFYFQKVFMLVLQNSLLFSNKKHAWYLISETHA